MAFFQTTVDEPNIYVNGQLRTADLRLLRCERWTGGKKPNIAVLEFRVRTGTSNINHLFVNRAIGPQFQGRATEVEIVVPTTNNDAPWKVIHWGTIAAVQPRMEPAGPAFEIISVMKPWHFGQQLVGYPVHIGTGGDLSNYEGNLPPQPPPIRGKIGPQVQDAKLLPYGTPVPEPPWLPLEAPPVAPNTWVQIPFEIVFNPLSDGQIIGNRHPLRANGQRVFVDPSQTWSVSEQKAHGIEKGLVADLTDGAPRSYGELWTLHDATEFICNWLNPVDDGGRVNNPPILPQAMRAIVIRNVRIPLGTYLPEALDLLLQPYGYDWFVQYIGRGQRTIIPFRRGEDQGQTRVTELNVFYQKPGEVLQHKPNNLESFSFAYDTTKTINRVRILGSPKLYEITVQLIPGWDARNEPLPDQWFTLFKSHPSWPTSPLLHNVYRQWVLNEGGSCIFNIFRWAVAVGGAIKDYKIDKAFDLNRFMATGERWTVRNRRFLPCITCRNDMTPIGDYGGLFIEASTDCGLNWFPLTKWGIGSVINLNHECGIRFDDEAPPLPLINHMFAGTLRMRVTAAIAADSRLIATHTRQQSVASEEQLLTIDAGDKYLYRNVHPRSIFYTKVRKAEMRSLEVDDTERILPQANAITDAWNLADCDGRLDLPTIEIDGPELGQVCTHIKGINFGVATDFDGRRGPNVIGIQYDYEHQQTTLFLNSYRGKISL